MSHPTIFYTLNSRDCFETLDRYEPDSVFRNMVEPLCSGWTFKSGGFWSFCTPPGFKPLTQGWKLHIAANVDTAQEILQRLVPLMRREKVAFKFCSDLAMVRMSTSKNWERTSAGKFITIYPNDDTHFQSIADCCHEATIDLAGPAILTDRSYKGSMVVYYRYGGHLVRIKPDPSGTRIPMIFNPQGELVPDRRVPYFYLPPWITDPFNPQQPTPDIARRQPPTLKSGRYVIDGVFRFSSCGGIYFGTDTRFGTFVVIREQRPLIGQSSSPLEKEARILTTLSEHRCAPRFVDLFTEQGHTFLVEERISADSLWNRTMDILYGDGHPRSPSTTVELFRDTIIKLVDTLMTVHSEGIVVRDLTKTNVLYSPDEHRIKLIDFELAYELDGRDPPVPGSTFGYGSPQQLANHLPAYSDDYYALGALLVDLFSVTAAGLVIHRSGILAALYQTLKDINLPCQFGEIAERLLDPEPQNRPLLNEVKAAVLRAAPPQTVCANDPVSTPSRASWVRPLPAIPQVRETLKRVERGIRQYIVNTAEYARDDRLWPSSPDLFYSNPVSIRFGATGIASYLQCAGETIPSAVVDWILRHADPGSCPPGLYTGLSGVAVFLANQGLISQASHLMDICSKSEDVYRTPGLYEGAAGWGLANLHLWQATGQSVYLDRASSVGDWLSRHAEHEDGLSFWRQSDEIPLGLARGASGIALFYVYLYASTRDDALLEIARRGIAFDLHNGSDLGDRVLFSDIKTDDAHRARTPHTFYGTAGVATAALRIYSVCRDERLFSFIDRCAYTVSSRYTNKLWQDWGISGFGELLIDCYQCLQDDRFLDSAFYLAEALLPYSITRPEGVVFPGAELLRQSCDYGVGAAGIGFFLNRLLNPHKPRFLLLDKLLGVERWKCWADITTKMDRNCCMGSS